jgi:heterodisulfide reductase subunit C
MNLFEDLSNDVRLKEGLKACINCGTCTAICPAAQYYDYDPRMVVEIVQRKNNEDIEYLLKSDIIWYCGECFSCKTRCPRDNTPVLIIQALKKMSIDKGFFLYSEKGRQQYAIVKTIGKHILDYGYCVYIDEIDLKKFPEQGPVLNWIKENIHTISKNIKFNYKGEGSGALRKIPEESIKELHSIFEITGGKAFFDKITKSTEQYFKDNKNINTDNLFDITFEGE